MRLQKVDALWIEDLAGLAQLVIRGDAILRNIDWQAVTLMHSEEFITQSLRLDRPTHRGSRKIGWRITERKT